MSSIIIPDWLKTNTQDPEHLPIDTYPPCDSGVVVYIYALADPRTGRVRYIGKSINPSQRLSNHMNDKSNCHRSHWIQELKLLGLRPELILLESFNGPWPWQYVEQWWIKTLRAKGYDLVNNTSGGDGVVGLPPETRAKMRATWLGRKHSESTKKKISEYRKAWRASDTTRAAMSAAHKGREILWIDKIAAKLRKFTAQQVREIEDRLAFGETGIRLAREFGCSRLTITKIKMGRYWDGSR